MAEEKSQIKKELKTFDSQFRKMSGRDPEKADKEVIRSLYLRCALDSLSRVLSRWPCSRSVWLHPNERMRSAVLRNGVRIAPKQHTARCPAMLPIACACAWTVCTRGRSNATARAVTMR